jgi:beta-mannosidase
LKDSGSAVIVHGTKVVSIEPLSAKNCIQLDFSDVVEDFQPESNYLEFTLTSGVNELGSGTVIFVPAKEFKLQNPEIKVKVDENETSFLLSVTSAAYARSVGLDLEKADCIFSDNYFDVSANAVKVIEVKKSSLSEKLNVEQFRNQLKVISVYDIA